MRWWLVVALVGSTGCRQLFDLRDPTISGDGGRDSSGEGSEGGGGICGATWYDSAWNARATITIDHTKVAAGNLTDFPALIDLTLTGTRADGRDVVFTAADGVTRLSHELERIDVAHVTEWVRIPVLSDTTDTTIYVYYINASASPPSTAASAAVWTNYATVWHLNQDPSGAAPQMLDSSSHSLAATSRGGMFATDQVLGKIGGSVQLDGFDDGFDVPSLTIGAMFSFELWMRKGANGGGFKAFINNQTYDRWFGLKDASQISFWDGAYSLISASLGVNIWYHLAVTYDGTNLRFYQDGTQLGPPIAKSYAARTGVMQLGYTNAAVGEYFPGQLDEVRISTTARSAGYIGTSYANQSNPATFYALGAPENCP